MFFRKSKTVTSTPLSNFVRNASSSQKKKTYTIVLKKASDAQIKVIKRAATLKTRTA